MTTEYGPPKTMLLHEFKIGHVYWRRHPPNLHRSDEWFMCVQHIKARGKGKGVLCWEYLSITATPYVDEYLNNIDVVLDAQWTDVTFEQHELCPVELYILSRTILPTEELIAHGN